MVASSGCRVREDDIFLFETLESRQTLQAKGGIDGIYPDCRNLCNYVPDFKADCAISDTVVCGQVGSHILLFGGDDPRKGGKDGFRIFFPWN